MTSINSSYPTTSYNPYDDQDMPNDVPQGNEADLATDGNNKKSNVNNDPGISSGKQDGVPDFNGGFDALDKEMKDQGQTIERTGDQKTDPTGNAAPGTDASQTEQPFIQPNNANNATNDKDQTPKIAENKDSNGGQADNPSDVISKSTGETNPFTTTTQSSSSQTSPQVSTVTSSELASPTTATSVAAPVETAPVDTQVALTEGQLPTALARADFQKATESKKANMNQSNDRALGDQTAATTNYETAATNGQDSQEQGQKANGLGTQADETGNQGLTEYNAGRAIAQSALDAITSANRVQSDAGKIISNSLNGIDGANSDIQNYQEQIAQMKSAQDAQRSKGQNVDAFKNKLPQIEQLLTNTQDRRTQMQQIMETAQNNLETAQKKENEQNAKLVAANGVMQDGVNLGYKSNDYRNQSMAAARESNDYASQCKNSKYSGDTYTASGVDNRYNAEIAKHHLENLCQIYAAQAKIQPTLA